MITTEIFSPGLPDGHLHVISKKTVLKELESCKSGDLMDVISKCLKILENRGLDTELFKVILIEFIKEL